MKDETINSLLNLIAFHTEEIPLDTEVSDFVIQKVTEKELLVSLQQGLITLDEAIDFIIGSVFTKFVKGKSLDSNASLELLEARNAVATFVKNSSF